MSQSKTDLDGATEFSHQNPRVDLIFNVVSGHSDPEDDLSKVKNILKQSFLTIRVWRTTPELDGFALAEKALDDGANVLVACGGDGTVAAVATAIKIRASQRQNDVDDESRDNTATDADHNTANSKGDNFKGNNSNETNNVNNNEGDAIGDVGSPGTAYAIESDQPAENITGTDSNNNEQPAESNSKPNGSQTGKAALILGVIPRGTANALADALEIPSDVSAAARMIANGPLRRIDIPTIPKSEEETTKTDMSEEEDPPHSMLLLAGIGLEAKTVKQADRGLKSILGVLAYMVAGLKALFQHKGFSTDVTLHDVYGSLTFAGATASSQMLQLSNMDLQGVTVANAAPPTSVLAQGVGNVCPDDGKLEVVCVQGKNPFGMIRTVIALLFSGLFRRRIERHNVLGLRARKITISCNPQQSIVVDGELAGKTPITIELEQDGDKIDVIAPKADVVTQRNKRRKISLMRFWQNIRGVFFFAVALTLATRMRHKRFIW